MPKGGRGQASFMMTVKGSVRDAPWWIGTLGLDVENAGGRSLNPRDKEHACTRNVQKGEWSRPFEMKYNGGARRSFALVIALYFRLARWKIPYQQQQQQHFALSTGPHLSTRKISPHIVSPVSCFPFVVRMSIHQCYFTPGIVVPFCSLLPSSSWLHPPTFLPPSFLFTRHHSPTSLSQINCQIVQVQLV